MQAKSITYSSSHQYGPQANEHISITLEIEEKDTEQEVLNYAKEFVLENSVSESLYNQLKQAIQEDSERLRKLNKALNEAEARLEQIRIAANELSKVGDS